MKEILKELKKYRGRGTVNPKAEFFHNTAITVMKLFESRPYSDLEDFAEFLKHYGKTAEITFHGVEYKVKSDNEFYSERLQG